ncbi:hypothetical protein EVAR_41883_1 [Eumeta japonica]|uniref:Uncharacterized protein n=1 Tax=Eumeta variegata TaxID=151549 RepID=A0A4C1YLX7_EUMVA|nr:hypothetical protein EVAR_41883_1 [Eumeta japonica]
MYFECLSTVCQIKHGHAAAHAQFIRLSLVFILVFDWRIDPADKSERTRGDSKLKNEIKKKEKKKEVCGPLEL